MCCAIGTSTNRRHCGHLSLITIGWFAGWNPEVSKTRFPQLGHFMGICILDPLGVYCLLNSEHRSEKETCCQRQSGILMGYTRHRQPYGVPGEFSYLNFEGRYPSEPNRTLAAPSDTLKTSTISLIRSRSQ